MVTVEMNFLPDVKLPCDVCNSARFNSETLSVLWRDKSIGDVLAMDVDDAVVFRNDAVHPSSAQALDVGTSASAAQARRLRRRGPAATLSGGERDFALTAICLADQAAVARRKTGRQWAGMPPAPAGRSGPAPPQPARSMCSTNPRSA